MIYFISYTTSSVMLYCYVSENKNTDTGKFFLSKTPICNATGKKNEKCLYANAINKSCKTGQFCTFLAFATA